MALSKYVSEVARKYHHNRYWKIRTKAFKCRNKFLKLILSFYLKRVESRNAAFIGLDIAEEDNFKSPPNLIHGLSGIFVTHKAKIGKNVTIMQQVTIGRSNGEAPTIGDDVFIGSGAKIIGKSR